MQRNKLLLKIIIPLQYTWFWNGIWILYYLKFTDYAGIGFIEALVITLGFILEVPTGAIADIFGRKQTIIFSRLMVFLGNMIMAFSLNYNYILISVVFITIGYSLMSGTSDAILYDSMLTDNEENKFDKTLSQINTWSFLLMAISSIIGGFAYSINNGLPYILTAVSGLISAALALLLIEPKREKINFSFRNYIRTNIKGFTELFKTKKLRTGIIEILFLTSLITITIQFMDGTQAIAFGFNEKTLGILFAILSLVSALGSILNEKIKKKWDIRIFWPLLTVLYIITLIISPVLGLILGGSILIFRQFFYSFINVAGSTIVNQTVESEYRATTLSAFHFLEKIPYVLLAFFIGENIDKFGANNVSFKLGLIYSVIIIVVYIFGRIYNNSIKDLN